MWTQTHSLLLLLPLLLLLLLLPLLASPQAAVGDPVTLDMGVVQLPGGLKALGGLVAQQEVPHCQTGHCHIDRQRERVRDQEHSE